MALARSVLFIRFVIFLDYVLQLHRIPRVDHREPFVPSNNWNNTTLYEERDGVPQSDIFRNSDYDNNTEASWSRGCHTLETGCFGITGFAVADIFCVIHSAQLLHHGMMRAYFFNDIRRIDHLPVLRLIK